VRDAPEGLVRQSHARQSCSPACSPANVVFRASIYDGSGYADEARGIIFGLYRAGFPVRVEPFGLQYDAQNLLNAEEQEILEALKHQRVDLARGVHFQQLPRQRFQSRDARALSRGPDDVRDGFHPRRLARLLRRHGRGLVAGQL
jgi:hypothetical protein